MRSFEPSSSEEGRKEIFVKWSNLGVSDFHFSVTLFCFTQTVSILKSISLLLLSQKHQLALALLISLFVQSCIEKNGSLEMPTSKIKTEKLSMSLHLTEWYTLAKSECIISLCLAAIIIISSSVIDIKCALAGWKIISVARVSIQSSLWRNKSSFDLLFIE